MASFILKRHSSAVASKLELLRAKSRGSPNSFTLRRSLSRYLAILKPRNGPFDSTLPCPLASSMVLRSRRVMPKPLLEADAPYSGAHEGLKSTFGLSFFLNVRPG